MFWLDGEPATQISLADRSFQYGDGCFTTILTKVGKPIDWLLHKERMKACLSLLNIELSNWEQIERWVEKAAKSELTAGVKLHISRGSGGRGYSPKGTTGAVVTIYSFDYPSHYLDWKINGVKLGVCQTKLGLSPLLAGHKHNNRLEQVLLKAEAEQNGYQDALVFDIQNHIVETTMANLFWFKDNVLYTPDLSLCGVAGIIRRKVLLAAEKAAIPIQITQFEKQDVFSAEEIFITNALLGVAPVIQIEKHLFPIGERTRYFQETLSS